MTIRARGRSAIPLSPSEQRAPVCFPRGEAPGLTSRLVLRLSPSAIVSRPDTSTHPTETQRDPSFRKEAQAA